jgi:hypothetical protein
MLVFRSEAHLDTWLRGRARGVTLSLSQLSTLAHAWWGDRLARDWQPRTREQSQAILDGLGLVGAFWQLG